MIDQTNPTDTPSKPWYLSKAAWSSILQILLGLAVSAGLLNAEANTLLNELGPEVITGLITAVLGALGLYGRVVATKPLSISSGKKSS